MAFFGVTHLGYQNPIGDNLIVRPRAASHPRDGGNIKPGLPPSFQEHPEPLRCTDTCNIYHQPLQYSAGIHHGSYERYKEMVKRVQTPRSPNQLYITPLTANQQYGWMMSRSPEPWTQIKRFPRMNSEMTKDPNFLRLDLNTSANPSNCIKQGPYGHGKPGKVMKF